MVAVGISGEFMRRIVVPLFVSVATRFALTRHEVFRFISQTRITIQRVFSARARRDMFMAAIGCRGSGAAKITTLLRCARWTGKFTSAEK